MPPHQLACRHHFVDEAERLALLRAHAPPGQDHAQRLLGADLARKAVQAARQRGQAHARLGQCEHSRFRRHDDVAGQRDLEAAAHGDAVHRRDQRLVEIETGGEPREARSAGQPICAARRR